MSETEKAIWRQAEILGLDWQARMDTKVRRQLRGVKQIVFVGTGTSYHCALWASWLCQEVTKGKIRSRAESSWDFLVDLTPLRRDELYVVISHRGKKGLTDEILKKVGKHRHILISAENTPTGKHPHIETSPQEISQAHTMSLFGAMAAISELIAGLLSKAQSKVLRTQRENLAWLIKEIDQDRTPLLRVLAPTLAPNTALHIVGGGAFHAIALELGLKAREIVHLGAHAYNTEQFLHGPVVSVDEKDTILLLEPFRVKGSALTQKLYNQRLKACEKAGDALGALTLKPSFPPKVALAAAKLPLAWQALLPLYWGQILCLAIAYQRRINPDSNRREDPRYQEALDSGKM